MSPSERLLRAFLREVLHPAIARQQAPVSGNGTPVSEPGKPAPVAPAKLSSAKTTSATQGYRVSDGAGRKGTVKGHEGALNKVKWDDGTETTEPGTSLKDIKELRVRVRAALIDQV